jgi:hypothetical protein
MFKKSLVAWVVAGVLALNAGGIVLAQEEEAAPEEAAQQAITVDVELKGTLMRQGYSTELTIGSMVAEGVHVTLNGSMNPEGFAGGEAVLGLTLDLFSLETKAMFDEAMSFTGANFKGQASLTEDIKISGRGAVSDTEFQSGLLSFTESMTGFSLKLDSMWKSEGLDDLALSGKKTFDLYSVSKKLSKLLGETPQADVSIQTTTEPVAFSWDGTLTMDGLQEHTVGASTTMDNISLTGSVSFEGTGDIAMMTAGGTLTQAGFVLNGRAGFSLEGYQNASLKFNFSDDELGASAEGEFKFNESSLTSGEVDAEVGLQENMTLLANAALDSAGLQEGSVGISTVLSGANTRAMVILTPEGYSGSSLFVRYPWEGYTFTGTARFDTEGYTMIQLTVNTAFDLQ